MVAKHFKPLPENAELTTPAYYKARCLTIGPHNYSSRLWEQREDVLLIVAKGGGDDYSRELALGRPVRPRGSAAAVSAAAAGGGGGSGGVAMFGMGGMGSGITFMGRGALGSNAPLSAADLLELDRRQDALSPRAEDAMRYSQLILHQLPLTAPNEQHRAWLLSEMRRFIDAGGVPGTPPLQMASDLLTAVRHARRMSAQPHPSEVFQLIADLRRASPGGLRAMLLVVGESRRTAGAADGPDSTGLGWRWTFLADVFGVQEMERFRAEAAAYVADTRIL